MKIQVLSADGQPVPGLNIRITSEPPTDSGIAFATTDTSGGYQPLGELPAVFRMEIRFPDKSTIVTRPVAGNPSTASQNLVVRLELTLQEIKEKKNVTLI